MKTPSEQSIYSQYVQDSNFRAISGDTDVDLSVADQLVLLQGTTGNLTINLPPAGKMVGKHVAVIAPDVGSNGNTVTLADNGDSYDWNGDYTLDADDDRILLYSDGFCWNAVVNNIA